MLERWRFGRNYLSKKQYKKLVKESPISQAKLAQPLDQEGNTLLHLSAIYQDWMVSDQLIKQGADPNQKNHFSLTYRELSNLLGANYQHALSLAIFSTKQNTLVNFDRQRFKNHFSIDYLDQLQFADYSIIQYSIFQTRRRLKKENIQKTNGWTNALLGKELLNREFPKIYIKWVNSYIGYGVFAMQDIAEYSLVGEYTGLVKKRTRKKDLGNDYIFGYVFGPFDSPYVIDAEKKGNFSRFINHSDVPNLTSRWIIQQGLSRIILIANQFIPKDTQLTYDYGPYYWKKRSAPVDL
jgi:hypothetical protein